MNVDHVWPPGLRLQDRMYFWIVRLLTRTPILSNSPRMRSAPQRRLLAAISRISPTVSLVTWKQTGCEQQTKSVCGGESWTGRLSPEHHDLVAKQGVFHEEFAPAANGVDQRRRRLRERRELPPDCGGAFPDAAQDQLEEVDHTSSSAPARRRA